VHSAGETSWWSSKEEKAHHVGQEKMKIIAKLLTIATRIIGALLILWGFTTGVIGIGPDTVSTTWRWIGITFGIVGCLYWIPHRKIVSDKKRIFAYLLGVLSPVLFVVVTIIIESNSGLDSDAILSALLVIGILSIAPATTFFRINTET
jgi:drug/metabolite transporter (DMT)-like permease